MFHVSLITIGDEILNADITDTNSVWITRFLYEHFGAHVVKKYTIPDEREEILQTLSQAQQDAPLVLITGGLGPTDDDITRKCLGDFWGLQDTYLHEPTLAHIQDFLLKRNLPLNERSREQARVFTGSTIFFNSVGTAPSMAYKKDNTLFVSLPGVPMEMRTIMQEKLAPYLRAHYGKGVGLRYKYVITNGIFESQLADVLQPWEQTLPPGIKLAYLPDGSFITLRLSCEREIVESEINAQHEKLIALCEPYVVATEKLDTLLWIRKYCLQNHLKIALAESCTGGYLAHLFTREVGASAFFEGAVVVYQNSIKEHVLAVQKSTLTNYTAVSEAVAREMIVGLFRAIPSADIGISTTGYLSATAQMDKDFRGEIYVAVGTKERQTISYLQTFTNDRADNLAQASRFALHCLWDFLLKEK